MAGIDQYAILYVPADGSDGGTVFNDFSYAGDFSGSTNFGTAQRDTAQKKFGTASLLLDGNSDYATYPAHSNFAFGFEEFTIDLWIRFNAVMGAGVNYDLIEARDDVNSNMRFYVYNVAGDHFIAAGWANNSGVQNVFGEFTPGFNTGQWYHVALIKGWNGNTHDYACTVDGVPYATATNSSVGWPLLASDLFYGAGSFGPGNFFNGWLDELRISKGIARWTEDFSGDLPSEQYSIDQVDPNPGDTEMADPLALDEFTRILCRFNGPDGSSVFANEAQWDPARVSAITVTGDPEHDTAESAFGSASLSLDGDDIVSFENDIGQFPMDESGIKWSWECWFRTPDVTPAIIMPLISMFDPGADYRDRIQLEITTGGDVRMSITENSISQVSLSGAPSGGLQNDTWHHVYVCRGWDDNANDWAIVIDGEVVDTDPGNNHTLQFQNDINIGAGERGSGPIPIVAYFTGHIDGVRVRIGSNQIPYIDNTNLPPTEELPGFGAGNVPETKLYLPLDGADGSTTMPDDSKGGNSGNRHGNANVAGAAELDTALKQYGTASLLCPDGDVDYIYYANHPDFGIGHLPMCIDFWFMINTYEGGGADEDHWLCGVQDSNPAFQWYVKFVEANAGGNDSIEFAANTPEGDSISLVYQPGGHEILNFDQFYHIAVVRGWQGDDNEWALLLDGVEVATDNVNDYDGYDLDGQLHIGNHESVGGSVFKGQIDEFRITRGIPLFTGEGANNLPPPGSLSGISGLDLIVMGVHSPAAVDGVLGSTILKVCTIQEGDL